MQKVRAAASLSVNKELINGDESPFVVNDDIFETYTYCTALQAARFAAEELSELTYRNLHSEALLLVAKIFAPDFETVFRDIQNEHASKGYLELQLANTRYRVSKELFASILETHGEDVVTQINKGL